MRIRGQGTNRIPIPAQPCLGFSIEFLVAIVRLDFVPEFIDIAARVGGVLGDVMERDDSAHRGRVESTFQNPDERLRRCGRRREKKVVEWLIFEDALGARFGCEKVRVAANEMKLLARLWKLAKQRNFALGIAAAEPARGKIDADDLSVGRGETTKQEKGAAIVGADFEATDRLAVLL